MAAMWTRTLRDQLIDLVDEVVPGWVTVTAQEDPLRHRVDVRLRASWWRRPWLSAHRRRVLVVRACSAVADAPAGVIVRVGWR